jgi:hypothetical protein
MSDTPHIHPSERSDSGERGEGEVLDPLVEIEQDACGTCGVYMVNPELEPRALQLAELAYNEAIAGYYPPLVAVRKAIEAYVAAADPVDRPDSETIEQAQQLVTYLTCPYYTQTGTKQCGSGCRDEPACMTSGPWLDEVVEVLTKVADLGSADPGAVEGEGRRDPVESRAQPQDPCSRLHRAIRALAPVVMFAREQASESDWAADLQDAYDGLRSLSDELSEPAHWA